MVEIEDAPGGKIIVWVRESGDVFGVTLLFDDGHGYSYTSQEGHGDFPPTYDAARLFAWARERWCVTPNQSTEAQASEAAVAPHPQRDDRLLNSGRRH